MKKSSKKPTACESISAHQMRFEFERVVKAVKAGRSLILTYRNKPVARIEPLNKERSVAKDDPISTWTSSQRRSVHSPTARSIA